MAEEEEARAMQLTELEQELIEKRRRLELLDQQLQEEGSASAASSPSSSKSSKKSHSSPHSQPDVTSRSGGASTSSHSSERSKPHSSSRRIVTKGSSLERSSSVTTADSSASSAALAASSSTSRSISRHHSSHSKHTSSHRDDHRDSHRDEHRDSHRDEHRDQHRDHSSKHSSHHRDRDSARSKHHHHRGDARSGKEHSHKRSNTSSASASAPSAKRSKSGSGSGRTVVVTQSKPIRVDSSSDGDAPSPTTSGNVKKTARRNRTDSTSSRSSTSSSSSDGSNVAAARKKVSSSSSSDSDSDSSVERAGRSGSNRKRPASIPVHKLTPPDDRSSIPMALRPITPTQYTDSASEEDLPGNEFDASPSPAGLDTGGASSPEFSFYLPALEGCRNVDEFEYLNRIEEGTYGVVFRGKEKKTGRIVALKKLKMEKEKEGFPITSLREVNTLLKSKHPNVVDLQEVAVGSNMDKIFLVMEYVEHDLKALMESMKEGFLIGEVKTLLRQLLAAVHHLHDNWILHRDLKTSNLLLSHKGILKVGDFGLAREYGSPPKPYTPIVVTLWYRAPELLLGSKMYTTAVDMWSVGCIFAELVLMKPLFQGRTEIDQIQQIFKLLGRPNEKIWPGWKDLPAVQKVTFAEQPYNHLKEKLPTLTGNGIKLLNKMLTFDPDQRISAEDSMADDFFKEAPLPVDPAMFPTWPARSELPRSKKISRSPKAPDGGGGISDLLSKDQDGFHLTRASHGSSKKGMGFTLKF